MLLELEAREHAGRLWQLHVQFIKQMRRSVRFDPCRPRVSVYFRCMFPTFFKLLALLLLLLFLKAEAGAAPPVDTCTETCR
ncbi:hypothetical protein GCM10023184_42010 [Flaviaesturariibacter amylovorans]|uniref:Uncharacterized protein n=1 Tax=Flaviaesturariibacter amylovorans TaxID=1084520 RepID=A0ABP8HPZ4_9BACT